MKPLTLPLSTGHKITVSLETVTPEQARQWLKENNIKNRKPRPRQIEILRREMAGGAWAFTHQGIAFGEPNADGIEPLLDGQHRLEALSASGVSIKDFLIFRNLPAKAQECTDMGQARSVAENLQMFDGEANTAALCSLVNTLAQTWGNYEYKVSLPQTREILKLFPKLRLLAKIDHAKFGPAFSLIGVRAVCGIAVHKWQAEAAAFHDSYAMGLNLSAIHPAWHLRNYCIKAYNENAASNFTGRSTLFNFAADCLQLAITGQAMDSPKPTGTGREWLRTELAPQYTKLKTILRLS
jgi:hypothetical protein